MKRRMFLGVSVSSLGVPALAASGSSLYGTPGSLNKGVVANDVHEQLSFSIGRLGVPQEAATIMAQTSHLWFDVLSDDKMKLDFLQDPDLFVSSRGLSHAMPSGSSDLQLLAACCDPEVADAAKRQDYDAFFTALEKHGFGSDHGSEIKSRVDAIIQGDFENFSATVRSMMEGTSDEDMRSFFAGDDLAVLLSGLSTAYQKSCTAIVGCLVAAVIAAIVAAYVSVVVAATVLLAVAIYITAALQVAVTVSTKPKSAINQMAMRLQLYGPTVVDSFQRVARIATITKSTPLLLQKYQELLGLEIRAIFEAAEKTGLIQVSSPQREEVYAAVERGSLRMLGVSD